MALFLNQQDKRSELQSRVASELREKLNTQKDIEMGEVEPAMTEDKTPTRGPGFVLAILGLVLIVAVAIWLMFNL